MLSLWDSIWPVPLGFLVALLAVMAYFFRKRLFSCLKGKDNSTVSGTYRQNGEINAGLDHPEILDPIHVARISNGQQSSREFTPFPLLVLPNHPSGISIISSPVYDALRCENRTASNSALETFDDHVNPPPSYSSLFYCPPPKYEDVVVVAQ